MKSTKFMLGALMALMCFALVNICFAGDTNKVASPLAPEQWVLTLGGVGATGTSGSGETAFGLDLSIGRTGHLLLPVEGGLRQSFSFSSSGEDKTLFNTRGYMDWTVLQYKKLDLFAGGNVGLLYGNTTPEWSAAPEAGLRYWLKKDVSVLGRVEYPYDLSNGRWQQNLTYFLGLQVKF